MGRKQKKQSSRPKEFVCALCRKEKMFFYHEKERAPKSAKWIVTIATEHEDCAAHSWELSMPDDLSAHGVWMLFKMFARLFQVKP